MFWVFELATIPFVCQVLLHPQGLIAQSLSLHLLYGTQKEWSKTGMVGLSLPFTTTNISNLTTWGNIWHTANFKAHLLLLCMFWCFQILVSSLQHFMYNPNGAFEHEVKVWKNVASLFRSTFTPPACVCVLPNP